MSAISATVPGMERIDAEWIKARLTGRHGEKKELAERLGIEPNKLTKILKGDRKVQADEVLKLVDFFDGRSSTEVAAIENGEPAPADTALVPVYDVSAAAGNGVVVDDYEIIARQLAFPPNYLRHITTTNPKDLAIISVTGGSMTPTLHHDDIVMVDTTKKNISYDGMFVIRHDGLLKVKRLHWGEDKKTIKVVSDNRLQHPEEEHSVSEIEVIGRVVWVGAKQP